MIHCQSCGADFANGDALEIHFGVGAPVFHTCNDAGEMAAKGMAQDSAGVWSIDNSLLMHLGDRVALRSNIADPENWQEGGLPIQEASNPAPGCGTTIDGLYLNLDRQPDHADSSETAWWNGGQTL